MHHIGCITWLCLYKGEIFDLLPWSSSFLCLEFLQDVDVIRWVVASFKHVGSLRQQRIELGDICGELGPVFIVPGEFIFSSPS